jgi:hypothetical protein
VLVWVYVALWVAEAAYLARRYAVDPPASTDPFSVALGWFGLIAMVVLLVYSIARRSRTLRQWGRLSAWLHFHIYMACAGVLAVFFHCWHFFFAERASNLLSPAVLSGAATAVVFFSGLVGRYLYSLLPRTMGGVQMQAREVEEELKADAIDLGPDVDVLFERGAAEPRSFVQLVRADLDARRAFAKLRALRLPAEKLALARRRLRLQRRALAISASERVFRRWIVLHRPLAAVLYVLAIVHVLFSYMFSSALAG